VGLIKQKKGKKKGQATFLQKKGGRLLFWNQEDRLYAWTFLTEKVACPLFYVPFFTVPFFILF
jgi:hypothetical protein